VGESFACWLLCGRGVRHFDEAVVEDDDTVERSG
jgi:hypothetical protein